MLQEKMKKMTFLRQIPYLNKSWTDKDIAKLCNDCQEITSENKGQVIAHEGT